MEALNEQTFHKVEEGKVFKWRWKNTNRSFVGVVFGNDNAGIHLNLPGRKTALLGKLMFDGRIEFERLDNFPIPVEKRGFEYVFVEKN